MRAIIPPQSGSSEVKAQPDGALMRLRRSRYRIRAACSASGTAKLAATSSAEAVSSTARDFLESNEVLHLRASPLDRSAERLGVWLSEAASLSSLDQQKTARSKDRSKGMFFSSKISTLTVLVPVRLV
jgi:hypothetical protein